MIVALTSEYFIENDLTVYNCANALAATRKETVRWLGSIPTLGKLETLTIVGHANINQIQTDHGLHSGAEFGAMLKKWGFVSGIIELVACSAGGGNFDGLAQQLANTLVTTVKAALGSVSTLHSIAYGKPMVMMHPQALLPAPPGEGWKIFTPKLIDI